MHSFYNSLLSSNTAAVAGAIAAPLPAASCVIITATNHRPLQSKAAGVYSTGPVAAAHGSSMAVELTAGHLTQQLTLVLGSGLCRRRFFTCTVLVVSSGTWYVVVVVYVSGWQAHV